MADLPRHPEASDEADTARGARPSAKRPWLAYGIGAALAVAVVVMIVLHLTGVVGPGAH